MSEFKGRKGATTEKHGRGPGRPVKARWKQLRPVPNLFDLNAEHNGGLGTAEDLARFDNLTKIKRFDLATGSKGECAGLIGCASLVEHMESHTLKITETTLLRDGGNVPIVAELRWRTLGENGIPKGFTFAFRAEDSTNYNSSTYELNVILTDHWTALAEAGLLPFAGAEKLVPALKAAEAGGPKVTVMICEGTHSQRGVEHRLALPENTKAVAEYEREHNTKIIVIAWICGQPGAQQTNFAHESPNEFSQPSNEYRIDWSSELFDKVIIVQDTGTKGEIEANTVGERLCEEYDLPRLKLFLAYPVVTHTH